jgi:MFS family permease
MIALTTAFFGLISGPMEEFGIRDAVVSATGMSIIEAEREGRIIMLYHSIAMAVVALEVYFITNMVSMKENQHSTINAIVTAGYLLTMIFGLWFGYFGHNPVFHGLFLFGQSLMFLAGILLVVALWPWKKEYYVKDRDYAHTKRGVSLERVAFFTMAVTTIGSSLFGAVAGSYLGSGFETFLAEDIVREPAKTLLQKSIIGHLHIMLTLIAIAITLIVGRWLDFKGKLHKIAMPLMIGGTIVISLGAWSVVLFDWAHTIIYFGSVFVMLAALMFVIFSWDKLIRTGLQEKGLQKGNAGQKIRALLRDPLKFGVGWQMVFMNFTVSGVGIFMAVKLDEIIRVWPWRDERIILTGHWHILSALVATIALMYYADLMGLKGRARKWFGWLLIISSNIAFLATTIFALKPLFVEQSAQQPLVNWTMLLVDIGLAIFLVLVALFLIWLLYDFLRKDGSWRKEVSDLGLDQTPVTEVVTTQEVL